MAQSLGGEGMFFIDFVTMHNVLGHATVKQIISEPTIEMWTNIQKRNELFQLEFLTFGKIFDPKLFFDQKVFQLFSAIEKLFISGFFL